MKTTNLNIRLTPHEKRLLKMISIGNNLSMTRVIVALIYKEYNKEVNEGTITQSTIDSRF